jgi:hypothetical protein
VSRHVPRRPGDPPRSDFTPLPFHGWYGCRGCGVVVYDWALHSCHEHEDQAADTLPEGVADLAARARAEGAAVAEFTRPRLFGRQAWRQVLACLRVRPPEDSRPAASPDPTGAAGRASARLDWTMEA